jgi:hypothetical protein
MKLDVNMNYAAGKEQVIRLVDQERTDLALARATVKGVSRYYRAHNYQRMDFSPRIYGTDCDRRTCSVYSAECIRVAKEWDGS